MTTIDPSFLERGTTSSGVKNNLAFTILLRNRTLLQCFPCRPYPPGQFACILWRRLADICLSVTLGYSPKGCRPLSLSGTSSSRQTSLCRDISFFLNLRFSAVTSEGKTRGKPLKGSFEKQKGPGDFLQDLELIGSGGRI